jgi:hypothetical protein
MSACGQVLVRFPSSNGVSFLVVAVTAFVSVLLALPTFSEIPLALGLLAAEPFRLCCCASLPDRRSISPLCSHSQS